MKAILEFNLPDDADDHRLALLGPKLASAIIEWDEMIRRAVDNIDSPEALYAVGQTKETIQAFSDAWRAFVNDWPELQAVLS